MKRPLLLTLSLLLMSGCGSHVADSPQWMTMGTVAKVSFKRRPSFSLLSGVAGLSEDEKRIVDTVRSVYSDVEARLSIWNKDSEISRFTSIENVSSETRPCYEAAFRLREVSGGVFNPFWRGKDKGPDLGAIAKGFAVDLAAERIVSSGKIHGREGEGLLLDLGGNLKVVSGEWRTGIRNPFGDMDTIVLTNGMACATSAEYFRGAHIRDAKSKARPDGTIRSVTVVHPSSAMLADGLSTVMFILGRERGEAFLRRHYPEARTVWIP
jgi:thiamine biosynthesis lipoprotein